MATQGIVSIRHQGGMPFKVVAGSNGWRASDVAEWARNHEGVLTSDQLFQAAIALKFGCPDDLIVQASDGSCCYDEDSIHNDDLGELYRDYSKFNDPRFNPRWECGLSDYVEIVDLE